MRSINLNTHGIVVCDPSEFVFVSLIRNENSSRCPLRIIPAADSKRLFICHLNQIKLFVQMDIQVHREGMLIHNRSLFVETVCKLFCCKLCSGHLLCFFKFLLEECKEHSKDKQPSTLTFIPQFM